MITVRIDASEAVSEVSGCSEVTTALIGQLLVRDSHGREKYGTTLDRNDLSLSDWLQHQSEELMDGAGYALAAKREAERLLRVEHAAIRVLAATERHSVVPRTQDALDALRDALDHTATQAPDS